MHLEVSRHRAIVELRARVLDGCSRNLQARITALHTFDCNTYDLELGTVLGRWLRVMYALPFSTAEHMSGCGNVRLPRVAARAPGPQR